MSKIFLPLLATLVFSATALAQSSDMQERAAAAKQAAAANQQALMAYTWTSTTDLLVKGEVKNTRIESATYGPDGGVQKTEIFSTPPAEKKRGIRGRITERKVNEMAEELKAAAALIQSYVPPQPDKLQAVIAAGQFAASIDGTGIASVTFSDYNKTGDALTLYFESATKALHQIKIDSWLDKESNKVVLQVNFASLPDGTRYAATTVLDVPNGNFEVRVENSGYQKLAQ